ncbi:unnamed protein product [Adineta steineri]|uniref:Lipocalin/cytosolic fatty-acid binding domain-containing protein n=1 Tax=Adineta steineri TaxID=433720 RepID=A0A814R2W7_9BILA|nr:unnamed protein product [Adineta steineri]CAF1603492.1 unnamed protein product [Adineta steineri]
MSNNKGVEALKGVWDQVNDENMDGFLKELGIGMVKRMAVKSVKPRLVISENGGKWTIRSESTLKTKTMEFTPDVEFDETTADGREVKTIVRVKGNAMEHTMRGKDGKECIAVRYINDRGQQQVDLKCGSVQAHRWFKRVE